MKKYIQIAVEWLGANWITHPLLAVGMQLMVVIPTYNYVGAWAWWFGTLPGIFYYWGRETMTAEIKNKVKGHFLGRLAYMFGKGWSSDEKRDFIPVLVTVICVAILETV